MEKTEIDLQNQRILSEPLFQTEEQRNEENRRLRVQLLSAQAQIAHLVKQEHPSANENLRKVNFTLSPYEEITNEISEAMMNQLYSSAPTSLRGKINGLVRDNKTTRNFLFEGQSGTGKSSLGKVIAYRCKTPYISIVGTKLADEYKNSASTYIDALFKALTTTGKRTALIIDEFNAFTDKLSNPNDADTGAVQDFWVQLDKYNKTVIFIATTNDSNHIPAQLLSRLEGVHKIQYPSSNLRLSILEKLSSDMDADLKKHFLSFASQTENFSLRDLQLLLKKAQDFANVRESNFTITKQDINDAFKEVKESIKEQMTSQEKATNEKKNQRFNQYYLPLIQLGISSSITIVAHIVQHYLTKHLHSLTLEQNKTHHQEMIAHQTQLRNAQLQDQQNIQNGVKPPSTTQKVIVGSMASSAGATAVVACACLLGPLGVIIGPFVGAAVTVIVADAREVNPDQIVFEDRH